MRLLPSKRVGFVGWFWFLLGLILLGLVVPGSMAWAASGDVSRYIPKTFTGYISTGDLSIRVLRSVFGRIGSNVSFLNLGDATVFSVVFRGISLGALFIESFIIAVMTTHLITESNIDNRGVDSSKTIWTSLRAVLSVSLLFPLKTGYSLIHNIIILAIIQGIGLANMLWMNATDYLFKQTKPFYTSFLASSSSSSNSSSVLAQLSSPDSYLIASEFRPSVVSFLAKASNANNFGSTDIARSMLCSHAVLRNLDSIRQANIAILEDYQSQNSSNTGGVVVQSDKVSQCLNTLRATTLTSANDQVLFTVQDIDEDNGTAMIDFPGDIQLEECQSCINSLKVEGAISGLKSFPEITSYEKLCGDVNYYASIAEDNDGSLTSAMLNAKKQILTSSILPSLSVLAKNILDLYRNTINDETENFWKILEKFVAVTYGTTKGANIPCSSIPSGKNISCSTTVVSDEKAVKNMSATIGDVDAQVLLMQNSYAYQGSVYGQLYQQLMAQSDKKSDANKMEELYNEVNSQGWMFIGNYYFKIAQAITNDRNFNTSNSNSVFINSSLKQETSEFYSLYTSNAENLKAALGGSSSSYYDALRGGILLVNAAAPVARALNVAATLEDDASAEAISKRIKDYTALNKTNNGKFAAHIAGVIALAALDPTKISVAVLGQSVPLFIAANHLSNVVDMWALSMTSAGDPVTRLITLGNTILEATSEILGDFYKFIVEVLAAFMVTPLAGFAVTAGAAWSSFMGAGIGASILGQSITLMSMAGSQMSMQFFSMFLPLIFGICMPLFACGIILTVYVPLIPTLLFLFGGISWLISVFVLLVAAPIICFLMLLGGPSQVLPLLAQDGERFVHQLIGAFFRPVLMVAGFLAGMMLCYVGFDLLHLAISNTYTYIIPDIKLSFSVGSIFDNMKTIRYLVTGLAFLMVYTYAAMSIVNLSFSMINLLYSEAMRLIGMAAPAVGLEERQVESTKAGAQQMGDTGGRSIGQIGESGGQKAQSGAQVQHAMRDSTRKWGEDRFRQKQDKRNKTTGSTIQGAGGNNNAGGNEVQGL